MVASVVSKPELNSIIFRYLLAHAEKPSLLKDSEIAKLREFSQKTDFYMDFITAVGSTIEPEIGGEVYDESRLLQIDSWIPQRKFKEILNCFKEMSGIRNPLHYSELGKIIPFVQSGFKEIAGPTLLKPGMVIKESARYNHSLNNDQKIVIESLTENGNAEARIQHYFLPSAEPHYLEMVTAALGYWEGIPLLWDWHKLGESRLFEVQIPLEELVSVDYAYLGLDFDEKKRDIYINGEVVGRRVALDIDYMPQKDYLTGELNSFTPIEILEDVVVEGDLIFPAGTKYGMPCNRYDLSIPDPGLGRRILYTLKRLVGREGKGFQFMDKDIEELANRSRLLAPQYEAMKRQRVEIEEEKSRTEAEKARAEAERARANTAEARAETAEYEAKAATAEATAAHAQSEAEKARADNAELEVRVKVAETEVERARADMAEAKLTLEKQVSEVNRVFADLRGLAHDNKNHTLVVIADACNLFESVLQSYPTYSEKYPQITEGTAYLKEAIIRMKVEEDTPEEILTAAESYATIVDRTGIMMDNDKIIMAGGIPIDIQDVSYSDVIDPVLESVKKLHPEVELIYEIPKDMLVRGDERLLKVAFTNLLHNAAEASPEGEIKLEQRQLKRARRNISIIDIYQTGYIPPEIVSKLNEGITFTEGKEEGNGVGAAASLNIITGPHNGKVRYKGFAEEEYGGLIRVMF